MLLLIPVVALLLGIFFFIKKNTRHKGKTVASLILHVVVAVILAVLAAGLSISNETDKQSTVILMDVSESTLAVRSDMTAVCESIIREFPEKDVKGVVFFGSDTIYVGRKKLTGHLSVEKADASGTDITAALYAAADLMNAYTHKRIILLSDGKETTGDALQAARRLAEEGVRIDTVYFDTNGQANGEAQINSMSTVGGNSVGDGIRIFLVLQSDLSEQATVSLYEGDTLLEARPVPLTPGEQILNFDLTAETAGMHCYRAVLTCAGDTEGKNNEAYAALRTYGDRSVLIIAQDPAKAEGLKNILSTESEVTVVSQNDAPTDLPALCDYDGYYLMNVDAKELPEALGEALDTAVKRFGKTLCFVGGDRTFQSGNMEGTLYEQMIPLEFGSTDGGALALIIVIDVSMSMVSGETNYLELAKVGAIKTLNTLQADDYVGVVTFSSDAEIVVKPTKMTAENKEKVTKAISSIQETPGTHYFPALLMAEDLFYDIKGDVPEAKHILFLSDGEPIDYAEDVYDHVQSMHESGGITITTIGMNADESDLYILKNMAKKAGGTFTYVRNALELPNIMLDQSENLLPQYAFEDPFVPQIEIKNGITEGIGTLPKINGYVGMHGREEATVYLTSERGDPVYASWQYGQGTVSCFTTDLTSTWCQAFMNAESGKSFIKNALKASYSEMRYDAAIIPTVTVDGNYVTVTAELPEGSEDFELMAVITGPERKKLALERISATTYEGSLAMGEVGEYEVTVTWKKRSKTVDEAHAVFAVSYSGEYNLFREGDGTLLSEIAGSTGGFADAQPDELARVDMGIIRSIITFELPLCIVAAVIMLVDIIIRRLTWADVKHWLKRGKR